MGLFSFVKFRDFELNKAIKRTYFKKKMGKLGHIWIMNEQ